MNLQKLTNVVTEAVLLDRQIEEKTQALKALRKLLITEAKRNEKKLVQIVDGGMSRAFLGHDGCIARITFPKPTLKDAIDGEAKIMEKIRDKAGKSFNQLFSQAPKYRLVANFRAQAKEALGASAKSLITLCTTASSVRVSYETKTADDVT